MVSPAIPMDEIVSINDQFYIQAGSKLLDDRTKVIKHDETFALFDRCGDIQIVGTGEQGLYHEGTRFLSHLSFRIWGRRPLLLSSSITQDNVLLSVDLTNPDIVKEWECDHPQGYLPHLSLAISLERNSLRKISSLQLWFCGNGHNSGHPL